MPILVQWKWEEKSKSYLVIFHFYDDFSKPNLRLKRRHLDGFGSTRQFFNTQSTRVNEPIIMTWAPSHTELALLSDLLHYANVIGGFPEDVRRDIRYDLEIAVQEEDGTFGVDEVRFADIDRRFPNPYAFFGYDKDKKGAKIAFFCVELSPEYIDYLKEIVKPCLK